MKKYFLIPILILFFVLSFGEENNNIILDEQETKIESLFNEINFNSEKPSLEVFSLGYTGYQSLENSGRIKNKILTLIDFSISANEKRMWVIDLDKKELLYHTLVAHGRNTGNEYATSFSNEMSSYKSSLGFYITGEKYHGKHGLSLRLDGIEEGINDKARQRAIVIHGADYVSEDFINRNGRLGRSLGCPALPQDLNPKIVQSIHNNSCLFIYYPNDQYFSSSPLLKDVVNV
jgi:hypothetical protein